ncbi:MAG: hypothetical protein WC750_00375 [Patescibacteria group bacterium]|jgi:hypothetical protein
MESIDPALNAYIDVLEKTNQQLSLWYNPYGVMVMILTILVALLAISFAYIIWRQGKEYKEAFKASLAEQKKIASDELSKWKEESKKIVDAQINEQKEKLKSLDGEAKEQVEKVIEDLKKKKESLESPVPSCSTSPFTDIVNRSLFYQPTNVMSWMGQNYCSFCGKECISGSLFCPSCGKKIN